MGNETKMEFYGLPHNGDDAAPIPVSDEDRTTLLTVYHTKVQARELKSRAKEMDERAKELGAPLMLALGVSKVTLPDVGTMSVKEGSSSSLDRKALAEGLLAAGLTADVVSRVINGATRVRKYVTLEFRAVSGKGKGSGKGKK